MLKEAREVATLVDGTKIFEDLSTEESLIDSLYLDKIRLSLAKSNEFLNSKSPNDLIIYVTRDAETFSYSNTLKEARFIVLLDRKSTFPPLIHEYMHIHQKKIKELWFQEGMAEYLAILIVENYNLSNLNDGTYAKYINAWKFSDTYVQWTTRVNKVFIEDLIKKYSVERISSIVRFDENIDYDDLDNLHDYYRLSASFCEFLCEKLGYNVIEEINNMAKAGRNNSVIQICINMEIDLKSYFTLWLETISLEQSNVKSNLTIVREG